MTSSGRVPDVDVPQYWSYTEPTRIDVVSARLAMLRQWIDDLSGVVVAKDPITPDEAREIAEAERKKSSDLFKSLQKEVHNPDKSKK